MKPTTWTPEQVHALHPCGWYRARDDGENYTLARITRLFAGRSTVDVMDAADMNIPVRHKIWLFCRPHNLRAEWLCVILNRAEKAAAGTEVAAAVGRAVYVVAKGREWAVEWAVKKAVAAAVEKAVDAAVGTAVDAAMDERNRQVEDMRDVYRRATREKR